MNRKSKLLDEQATIVDERAQLLELWEKEDRGPDEKERARTTEIKARLVEIDAELEAISEHDARSRQSQTYNRDLEPPTEEELAAAASASANAADASAVATAGTGADIGKPSPRFPSFGEELQAMHRAENPASGPVDPRLLAVAIGMGENVPSDGGFLVEQAREKEIRDKIFTLGQVLQRTDNQAIGAGFNGVKIPAVDETSRADGSRWGGIQAFWTDEGGALTASSPKIKLLSLELKKLTALVYITDELLADSVALENFVSRRVPLELTFKVENALFRGTGAGQPEGILSADATVEIIAEVGQAANTILWDNIKKMYARMWASSRSSPGTAWWINQDVEPQLMSMSQVVGTGGVPVYLPANGAAGTPFATLMGIPVIPVEYCSTLGTVGDIVLADFGQYITIDKGGVQSASSMHVRFLTNEMAFRFVFRIDGQPMWSSALTPFQGTNTLSPFITLATRA